MSLVLDMSSKTQTSLKNEARQHSDERWRAAFENFAIGIMMANVNGRPFAANRVFRNMLGYSELELYRLTFLDVTYDEDRHNNLKLVRELVDGKRQHFQMEKRYLANMAVYCGCVRTQPSSPGKMERIILV